MIDIENIVFDTVYNALNTAYGSTYPDMTIYGEYVPAPSGFPSVQIVEADNYTYTRTQDEQLTEHNARLMYTVDVYTDNITGKKSLAKQIANTVDTEMQNMKFTRTMYSQTPNVDRTIYRITMRYEAVVAEPKTIDGNTVYQMYRQ